MKIGFIGAAATGKTTVANILGSMLPEKVVPSIVRNVMKQYVNSEKEEALLTPEERLTIQRAIYVAKIYQDRDLIDGIFDRTPIDHLMYCTIKCFESITEAEYYNMYATAMDGLSRYDALFYFPVYAQMQYEDDGFRRPSKAYQILQECVVRELLRKSCQPYKLVPFLPPEERAELIHGHIEIIRKQGKPERYPEYV